MQFSTEVPEALTNIIIVFTLVAGTAFIMWMGELITQRGIGNGMSLIIFVSIVSRVPSAIFLSLIHIFNLRFQMATSQLDNTARVKQVKKDIARIMTEMRARELSA